MVKKKVAEENSEQVEKKPTCKVCKSTIENPNGDNGCGTHTEVHSQKDIRTITNCKPE